MGCPYETLGIDKAATQPQIKAAYRKLALKLHPDKNFGKSAADKQFKEVNEAYELLRNPEKKEQYDKFGSQTGYSRDPFEDFFASEPFSSRIEKVNGRNITLVYAVSLCQLISGASIKLSINTKIECDACKSRGRIKAEEPARCRECRGKGTLRRKQGFIVFEQTCFACNGSGVSTGEVCAKCGSEGRIVGKRIVQFCIQAGADTNSTTATTTKFESLGEAGSKSAAAGDLYVKLVAKPHEFYTRYGADLLCSLSVEPLTVSLGGRLEIKTPAGQHLTVSVPALASTTTNLVVRRRGLAGAVDVGNLNIKLAVSTSLPIRLQPRFSSSLLTSMFKLNTELNHILNSYSYSDFIFPSSSSSSTSYCSHFIPCSSFSTSFFLFPPSSSSS